MTNDDLQQLIDDLKQLKLREIQILEAIGINLQNQQNDGATTNRQQNVETSVSTPTNTTPTNINLDTRVRTLPYIVGDRIVITNNITRLLNRPTNRGDRTGIVTKVTQHRINIKTSNGTDTWRAPQNLRFRRHDE
jgi:hypothetical protein